MMRPPASRRTALVLAAALLAVSLPPPSAAFDVALEPATRLSMNLELPADQFASAGYGVVSFRGLAESAVARWNVVGVGSGLDHQFFSVQTPAATGVAPCGRDGVNEVRFADSFCGMSFGDALAVTAVWHRVSDSHVVEADVMLRSDISWDAYPGAQRPGVGVDFFRVVLHELGHAIGLAHPDEAGQQVTALMNSRISDVDALRADDILGVHAIAWGGAAVESPLYRFFNRATGTHFYTASDTEMARIANALSSYSFEGVAYNVPVSTVTGAAPVYRFFNTATGTHFYTISADERDRVIATLPGFHYEGIAFYGFPGAVAGASPVYRFFNRATGTHFYTTSAAERDNAIANLPQLIFEGTAYYAY